MMRTNWNMTAVICVNNGYAKCVLIDTVKGMKVGWYVIVVGKGKGETMKDKIREIVETLHRDLCHFAEGGCKSDNPDVRNKIVSLKDASIEQLAELFEVSKAEIYEEQGLRIQELAKKVMEQKEEIAELKAELKALRVSYNDCQRSLQDLIINTAKGAIEVEKEIAELKKELEQYRNEP